MSRYAKFIGGALGWALGGPIGAIMGYAFGSMVADKSLSIEEGQYRQAPHGGGPRRRQTGAGDFAASMIVLSAAVMKADDRILKSELDYVKRFFVSNFGTAQSERYILTLREVLKQDVDTRAVCRQIQTLMEHSKRLLLLQYLYGIAQADGDVDPREVEVIRQMATWLGISAKDVKSIEASFYTDVASHYAVLEIPESATDSEVKKAFRRMAVKFHPDKVRDMGEDYQKQARERFDRITAAYEAIKKQRGIK
jgi:DnaJ like chaperone protein